MTVASRALSDTSRPVGDDPAPDVVLRVAGLRKTYGDLVAVDDLSFEVTRGEVFGVLGPNGAGKTTALECIQGLRAYDSGSIEVVGLDPSRQADRLRQHIGCQLQQSALPDNIRVWEALDLFASVYDAPRDWRVLMEQWGLAEKRNTRFHNLSGGQKQRLFVALALVNDPQVVFLDEMTTGLDPAARHVAWSLIEEMRAQGTTVVLVTHFMEEAERLCDRLAVVDRGRLVALDTSQSLVASSGGGVRAVFSCDPAVDLSLVEDVRGVSEIVRSGRRVEVAGDGSHVAWVAAALVEHGIHPEDFRVAQPTLEDAYLRLTTQTTEE
ncbi:MAG: ABC transporter ATP-binding protein [Thermoleophilia bacterium]|nr:ABC transporter ATP-binding protein [Thermoleophilia bacterium]